MSHFITPLLLLLTLVLTIGHTQAQTAGPTTIAFGACAQQNRAQPIWDAIVAKHPDLFIFTGDNIYGDTTDMSVMQTKYNKLAAKPGYQKLVKSTPILAVYDDHDYGQNDGGKHYPEREASAKMCLDFFNVPQDDPRRTHPGIYGSSILGEADQRIQIILLDTRYFRDDLDRNTLTDQEKKDVGKVGWYQPTTDTSRTLLGEPQWAWLKTQLQKPAEVRIIVSSIQTISWEKGMECWGNMPHQRTHLFKLIADTKAKGVVLISGDVHFAEISKTDEGPYPLYDITSSGLAQKPHPSWPKAINQYRIPGCLYVGENFGLITIDWATKTLCLQACDVQGQPRLTQNVAISALQIK